MEIAEIQSGRSNEGGVLGGSDTLEPGVIVAIVVVSLLVVGAFTGFCLFIHRRNK